jgi:hypothetical protein
MRAGAVGVMESLMKHSSAKYYVEPAAKGGWSVRRGDGAAMVFTTQREAIAAAQAEVRQFGGELNVQAPDGRLKKSFTLGRSTMEKLNAVEGVALSARARRTFAELDRVGAGPEARRTAIADTYRKARS